ncbi:sushi, von Willebrand factor type A, EGF and pentraxin domain-containing protein 1-like [Mercenaria mercenaria]|uniref:sushi, von Willebrand factor type A, EGF and pentraxin domain-containing protein 1-like n=1 Tax=Mercenaria mercenaria TaxID=6596 RepID=UPI00234E92D2|nr:sushi, von Willebrand factor type A, EGF and pentraxin domain-containing protein 1-like [Mercenaria mercenaria]
MEIGLALSIQLFSLFATILLFTGLCEGRFSSSLTSDDPIKQTSFINLEQNSSSTCNYFCNTTVNNDTNKYAPPEFTDPCTPPEILSIYMSTNVETSVEVFWTEPNATDQNGDVPRIDQVTGDTNGSYFNGTAEGHRYDIVYLATDKNGLKDSCYFAFQVYVPEPLAVHCISPQAFYTDSQQTSVAVIWQLPTSAAIVNNIVALYQTEGPNPGDILESGLHKVVYKMALNETNKSAECSVDLHIKVVTCEQPALVFNDSFMLSDCSSPTLILGTKCQLTCRKNLQVAGNSFITCVDSGQKEGMWDWGVGEQPFCNETACPLNVENPVNGTVIYKSNGTVSEITVVCDEGFDFQYQFSGQILCINNEWVYDQMPDCVAVKPPEYTLEATLSFSGQGCADNALHLYEEYQSVFQIQFENEIASICPEKENCKVYNTLIECTSNTDLTSTTELSTFYTDPTKSILDPVHSQQKIITHTLKITLKISIQTEVNNSRDSFVYYKDTISQVWEDCRKWFVSTVLAGIQRLHDFDIMSWDTGNHATPTCQKEYLLAGFQCKTCSTGYYLNKTLDKCQKCPYGSYKDEVGIAHCQICPEGTSTTDIGSRSVHECKEYCEQGSVSIDGLKSCAVCPKGYYQDENGQTQCKICPPEATTILANSTSVENCTAIQTHGRCNTSSCNGHRCLNKGGNISCVCSYGWSGESCEQPSDTCIDNICMNGAECQIENSSYACECKADFLGVLCEVSTVNGGWAEWSIWSECSVTCGDGSRQRKRLCNNPPPTEYGKTCFGLMSESKMCVMDECQACPSLTATNNSYHHCTENRQSGLQTCSLRCKDGFILGPWFDLFLELTCGMQTGLTWLPANLTAPCSESVKPQSLLLESSIEYDQLIPMQYHDMVKNSVLDKLLHTDCFKSTTSSTCLVEISLKEELKSTNADDELRITKMELSLQRNVTQNENLIETGISAEVVVMERTAEYMEKFSSEIFSFHVDDTVHRTVRRNGIWFTANTNSLNIHGTVICDKGQVAVEGICSK